MRYSSKEVLKKNNYFKGETNEMVEIISSVFDYNFSSRNYS